MFTIEMLPAVEGDALWIEYGDPDAPHRILVDCGYKSTYRTIMKRLRSDTAIDFELMVLTHIDGDHIAGAVPFIKDRDITPQRVKQVWFNSREQIFDTLGVRQAEYFTETLDDKGFAWNTSFGEGVVMVPDDGILDPIPLAGGMNITVLSPGRQQLRELHTHWTAKLDDILKGRSLEEMLEETPPVLQPDLLGALNVRSLAGRDFKSDDAAPNGSSIAFLAEYIDAFDGGKVKRALFAGDAFAPVLEKSVQALLHKRQAMRLPLDAFKVSHHGSQRNTSSELLKLLNCRHFLISTNGNRHKHPDDQTIARILVSQDTRIDLHFNYLTDFTKVWKSARLEGEFRYTPHYPPKEEGRLRVEL